MQLDQSNRREFKAANRWALVAFALVVVVGLMLIGLEIRSGLAPLDSPSAKTTTTETSETKKTATGQTEITTKREVATRGEDFVDRTLGKTGIWFMRILLVVLAAFLTGALVQRVILGKYAFEIAGTKLPEIPEIVPANTQDAPQLPDEVIEAFAAATLPDLLSAAEPGPPASPDVAITSDYVPDVPTGIMGIMGGGPAEYTVVDLGTGRSWLTTRLFIAAILLKRMRSLKTFVFVESRDTIDKRFIGVVAPDVLRWALAREYPWLEESYARGYGQLSSHTICRSQALWTRTAQDFSLHLSSLTAESTTAPGAAGEWQQLAPERWEHGQWISRGLLERLVAVSPIRSSVVDVGDLTPEERVRKVLAREGSFVALIDDKGVFTRLVDRKELLERMAVRLTSAYPMH